MTPDTIGTIFNTICYAIHDGPGIRTTVFFKGCPIRCHWCSNPESQKTTLELSYLKSECILCGKCMEICPRDAINLSEGEHSIDRTACNLCGKYVDTAIETCLHVSTEVLLEILPLVDHVICDMKIMDKKRHKQFTGASNTLILKNIATLLKTDKDVLVRMPLLPGVNDDETNLKTVGEFLQTRSEKTQLELIPYHRLGEAKYERIGRIYTMKNMSVPSNKEMANVLNILKNFRINLVTKHPPTRSRWV